MKKEIDILELFSGIGGFTKGFEEAGYKIKNHSFSEVDKHAIANYKYNFPNAKSIGSVTDVRHLERPDIITFGSPCQDFSLAGKRAGMEGNRSSLITEAIRLITDLRPSVFIWENVKGTFSSNNGQDFWAIIAAFANIGGYRLEWQLLNTSWFLPQNRERIYLIGHLAGASEPGVFPFTKDGGLFDKQKGTNQRWPQAENSTTIRAGGMRADDTFIQAPKIAGCLTAGGHSGGLHSDMTTISVATPGRKEKNQNGSRFKENDSFCLTAEPHGVMIKSNTKKGFDVANEGDTINFSNPNSETRRGRVGVGVANTLDTQCNQGVVSGTWRTHKDGNGFRELESGGR